MELHTLQDIAEGVASLSELERSHPVLGRRMRDFVGTIESCCNEGYNRFSSSLNSVLTLSDRPTKAEKTTVFANLQDASDSGWFRDVARICDALGALAERYRDEIEVIASRARDHNDQRSYSLWRLIGILNKHEQAIKYEIRYSVDQLVEKISSSQIAKARADALEIKKSIAGNLDKIASVSRHIAGDVESALAGALSDPRTNRSPTATILFCAANPVDTGQLRLDEEVREIAEGLRRSKHRDYFNLAQRWAVRAEDLRRGLLDEQPSIVHFSGHGSQFDGLIFENRLGQPEAVPRDALVDLFSLFSSSVDCVVLNACFSSDQASAIAEVIPCVVGMTKAIGDQAAIQFAVGFYDALGAGRSYEDAFRFGRNAISLAGIPEHHTPQLLKRPGG